MKDKPLLDDQAKRLGPLITLGILVTVLIWAYWNSLMLAARFWDNPKYSHGYIVPLFTLLLLRLRRDAAAPIDATLTYVGSGMMAVSAVLLAAASYLDVTAATASFVEMIAVQVGVFGALLIVQQPMPTEVAPSARWAGVALLSAGLGMRLASTYFPNATPEMFSFIPSVAGLFLVVGGWPTLRWAGAPLAFLIFMFPLPSFLDRGLLAPLQKLATEASTYCLQTLGIPAVNESNKIALGGNINMEVVEACSGLRMLTIFVALAVAITMITQRPLWERIIIVLSAVPIALAVNIIRITVTGIMYITVGAELADRLFHAMAGLFMMPMALGLLYVEFQILSHMFVDDGLAGPLPISGGRDKK